MLCRSWASKPGPEGSEGAPSATARRPSGCSWWRWWWRWWWWWGDGEDGQNYNEPFLCPSEANYRCIFNVSTYFHKNLLVARTNIFSQAIKVICNDWSMRSHEMVMKLDRYNVYDTTDDEDTKEDHGELFSERRQPLYQLLLPELHYTAARHHTVQLVYWIWHRYAAMRLRLPLLTWSTFVLFMTLLEKDQSIILYYGTLRK